MVRRLLNTRYIVAVRLVVVVHVRVATVEVQVPRVAAIVLRSRPVVTVRTSVVRR